MQILQGRAHPEVVACMQDLVFSIVCFVTIIVIQITWFHNHKEKPPVEVLLKRIYFLLADVQSWS